MTEHDHRVKPQIRGFFNDLGAITVFSGDNRFRCFFTDFLKDLVETLFVQSRYI